MRRFVGVPVCGLACILAAIALHAVADHPSWAYGFSEPPPGGSAPGAAPVGPEAQAGRGGRGRGIPGAPDGRGAVPGGPGAPGGRGGAFPGGPGAPAGRGAAPGAATLHNLPDTDLTFTQAQTTSAYGPADWYPGDHPAAPPIVANGNQATNVMSCAVCHYATGKGRPESAPLADLPVEYFVQTMHDFKNGLRNSADPRKGGMTNMIGYAKAMTDEEILAAAKYYASMPWNTPFNKVVEASTVPVTRPRNGVFYMAEGSDTEPLGMRIVETPEHTERFQLHDPRTGSIVYAPIGSLEAGEALVKTGGNGKTVQCTLCHGAKLEGLGPVPGIAGRSPSYLVRQLYDMQMGTRKGVWVAQMKQVVEKLTAEDLVAIGAYTASLVPR